MNITKMSMFLLAAGLTFASCGNSETTDETTTADTVTSAPMAEEATPVTPDTTVIVTDTAATTTPTP